MESTDYNGYGLVSNIQKYTIHDGPGIRTEIFFKGCPLRCKWCSNPEAIAPYPELGIYPVKCVTTEKCSFCLNVCPAGNASPIVFDGGRPVKINASAFCDGCFRCAALCPGRAIKLWGESYSVSRLMSVIREDIEYYTSTGGGVTLSGGEVTTQWEFARELLRACRIDGISTCVETCMFCPTSHLDALLEFCDLIICDIKHIDPVHHREGTGVSNELILRNIRHCAELEIPLIIRTPVVPGYNDDREAIRAVGSFIKDELGGRILQYQLLPYRKMGTEKYESLNMPYPMGNSFIAPGREVWEKNLSALREMLISEFSLNATAGSG